MSKLNVCVMFGGRSVEHEVSIITGLQVVENIDKEKYDVTSLYVSKDGDWYVGEELTNIKNYRDMQGLLSRCKKVYLPPVPSSKKLLFCNYKGGLFKKEPEGIKIDVVFPAFHGMHGEDGTIQGLFELADIPYVGSRVIGSAVGMDKIIMKDIFKANGVPIVNYTWFLRKDYEKDRDKVIGLVEETLKYPMFVKPCSLGSSIGISKAKDKEGLINAIETAIRYDRKIIVEEACENLMEINCSVMGFGGDYSASLCEQPVAWEEFLSFDDKYMRSGNTKGMKGLARKVPAPISDEKTKEIQDLAIKVFRVLDCSGISRIDFMLDQKQDKVYVNEINTMPGSVAFYLWEPLGISFKDLITKLIEFGIKGSDEYRENIYTFDTALLDKVSLGGAKGAKGGKIAG